MRFPSALQAAAAGAAVSLSLALPGALAAQTATSATTSATTTAAAHATAATAATAPVVPFEGVIHMTVGRHAQPVTYSVRQGMMRVDAAGRGGRQTTVIVDTPNRLVDVLAPRQRVYFEQALVADSIPTLRDLGVQVTRTGRSDRVAGRSCEHWTLRDDRGQTVDACMASGLGALAGIERVGNVPLLSDLGAGGYFPVLVTLASTGETLLRVTAIEPRALDAARFALPAGYQKVTVAPGTGWGGR